MNSNEIALLNLIKKSLFNSDITFSEDTDWEEVHKEESLQMVMALTAVPCLKAKRQNGWSLRRRAHPTI
jgi:hypothetical protein